MGTCSVLWWNRTFPMVYFRTDLSYPNFLAVISGLRGLLFPSHIASSTVRVYLPDENAFRHFDVERGGVG